MVIYVKLGEKASSFSDPISKFNIAGSQVLPLTDSQQKSKKTATAIKSGHLVRATRTEHEASRKQEEAFKAIAVPASGLSNKDMENENKSLRQQLAEEQAKNAALTLQVEGSADDEDDEEGNRPDFDNMEEPQLLEYYEENYEVNEKDIKAFKKLSKEEKVAELIRIESL